MPDPFPETRWSMILRLRAPTEGQRQTAFSELCSTYWRPLYPFAHGAGCTLHDAEDLVQVFLAQLLTGESFGRLSPEPGRMRTFLKVAFRRASC
jgi:RNA polymerase sigma-70 factor (ECF subfamily)